MGTFVPDVAVNVNTVGGGTITTFAAVVRSSSSASCDGVPVAMPAAVVVRRMVTDAEGVPAGSALAAVVQSCSVAVADGVDDRRILTPRNRIDRR